MTLKQFTTVSGKKIIVNMEQVEYIDNDCVEGRIRLNIMGDALICVKGTLKSIMSWYQKQSAKNAQTIEIPQATFTPFYYKEGQLPIDITPKITWSGEQK